MTHYNLIHVNLPSHSQVKPSPAQHRAPSPKNLPIKKGGKGEGPSFSHSMEGKILRGGRDYLYSLK